MLVLRLYNACLLLASTPSSICNVTQSWANPTPAAQQEESSCGAA